MAITKEFAEAVESGKTLRVRIMLKDILIVDPTAAKFDEMEAYASSVLGDIYDEHDGEALIYDATKWSEDYLNEQMVNVVNNFSKERIELLKGMVRYIYPEKVQRIKSEQSSAPARESRAIRRRHVGVGVTAAGGVMAVAGICTSQTFLTVGGIAAAAVGIVLIATDKE